MQVIRGEIYKTRAVNISRRTAVIPAGRGEIYANDYKTLIVYNTDSFVVRLSPAEAKSEINTVLERLSGILGTDAGQLRKRLPEHYGGLYQPVDIASGVPYRDIAAIAGRIDELPGVSWQPKPARNYSATGSLAHITGYVGEITKDELTTLYNSNYKSGDLTGKAGIEKQYDGILRGRDGSEIITVDVQGRADEEKDILRDSPRNGKTLVLTIDRKMQTLAEKALGRRTGAVVVTRPETGEILALVSYPWYDPGIFASNNPGQGYQNLLADPDKPLLNRAIQSHYPPGSTFKVVMTTGILAENAFPPEKRVECPGEIDYGSRVWRCHIRRPGHGWLALQKALAQSCDIYFWVVGRDYLNIENIVTYAKDFGLGALTGVDLPGEIAGFIPTPQWKERTFHEKWLGGDTMNMSIGQGYTLVTPLQMANMVSMAVNDGIIYRPHILKEVRDPESGAVERIVTREPLHKSEVRKEVFTRLKEDMRSVISEGTARFPVNIKAVEIAGKTGTSEVGLADHWHSWFAAYAPYQTDNPKERVVVSIIVEASNKWEWWAPYASAIIFQGIFAGQTYEEAVRTLGFQYLIPELQRRD